VLQYPEDGKTMLQRAGELKEYKNLCKGNKPTLTTAFESKEFLLLKQIVSIYLWVLMLK